MTQTKNLLKSIAKIVFVLSAVMVFLSTFFPIQDVGQNSSSYGSSQTTVLLLNTFAGVLGTIGGSILLISFLIGFILALFGDKKKALIGNALYASAPISCLIIYLSVTTNLSASTAFKMGLGPIFLFVALFLYAAYLILNGIVKLLFQSGIISDIDERISLLRAYQEFKDQGVITEEEFQAKREEILQLASKKKTKN